MGPIVSARPSCQSLARCVDGSWMDGSWTMELRFGVVLLCTFVGREQAKRRGQSSNNTKIHSSQCTRDHHVSLFSPLLQVPDRCVYVHHRSRMKALYSVLSTLFLTSSYSVFQTPYIPALYLSFFLPHSQFRQVVFIFPQELHDPDPL